MTYYQKKLQQLRATVYANDRQIDTVVCLRNQIEEDCHLPLNLDVLSRSQFVSKYHLLRLFKKYYGQTPRQYLIDRRIERSKMHLSNGLSVTQTCFAVGFESLGSFSTLFKSRTGNSPKAYQKKQLSRSKSPQDA